MRPKIITRPRPVKSATCPSCELPGFRLPSGKIICTPCGQPVGRCLCD